VQPVRGRLQALQGKGGIKLYDDSYNANPASVAAAAEFVAAQSGESWLVLGDMGELGREAAAMHRAIGESARRAGVSRLLATGSLSQQTVAGFGAGGEWFESIEALIEALLGALRADVNVLVKGSRAMRMERVVAALSAAPQNGEGH
jgi:UDP-N-acetylmuramoyl-tripeptide--D-alanyl-D-alanine ligase